MVISRRETLYTHTYKKRVHTRTQIARSPTFSTIGGTFPDTRADEFYLHLKTTNYFTRLYPYPGLCRPAHPAACVCLPFP